MRMFSNTVKRISIISDKIAGGFIVLVMLLVVVNVVLRAVFNSPLKGTYELVGLLTAVAIALGLAYCAFQKGHIAVGFIVDSLPQKFQAAISLLNDLIGLCFWSTASWFLMKYAHNMMEKGLVTPTAEVPVYPFIYLLSLGFFILCLTLIKAVKDDITALRSKKEEKMVQLSMTEEISEGII